MPVGSGLELRIDIPTFITTSAVYVPCLRMFNLFEVYFRLTLNFKTLHSERRK